MSAKPSTNCPVCRGPVETNVLCRATLGPGTGEYDLAECPACGVRFLDPLPQVEHLQKFYGNQYYGTDWYKQRGWGMAFAKSALRDLPPGRFLDIGCGLGFFMESVRRHAGWEVYGVEFGAGAVEFARRELGLDVRRGSLEEAGFGESFFDYIQIRNVLEHVTDPVALLRECRRILKPGGAFHLFVPNGAVDSLDLIRFEREEGRAGVSKSGHLFFFPRRTLLRMFDETGFRVERARTYGIRRGLGSLGLWPRAARKWKRGYDPKDEPPAPGQTEITLPPEKRRPDAYYRYRQLRMNLRMLPGLREFGLDYELILRPKE